MVKSEKGLLKTVKVLKSVKGLLNSVKVLYKDNLMGHGINIA